jgi:hypothetical protein
MTFNRATDKIAITVPEFTFKKGGGSITDWLYSEPYLVTLAIDSQLVTQESLNFNFVEFPNVRSGNTVKMLGDGHLVYGPSNPGEFVAVSVLLMESNSQDKELGKIIGEFVKSGAVEIGVTAAIAANPGAGTALKLVKEVTAFVSDQMKEKKDTPLYRVEGIFLRDTSVPYSVNRQITSGNEFADLSVKVIPLNKPNGQGPVPEGIGS